MRGINRKAGNSDWKLELKLDLFFFSFSKLAEKKRATKTVAVGSSRL
jgi:hypothetical protein